MELRDVVRPDRHREDFDEIFGRLEERGLADWADPGHHLATQTNAHAGERGVYFDDPSGHSLEIITWSYAEAARSRRPGAALR